MAKNIKKLATLMGAEIIGQVPVTGGGAFGAARLAHILATRLEPSEGERFGRPSVSTWTRRHKVPMSEATERQLAQLAKKASGAKRKVSPMRIAAQVLEEAQAAYPDE